MFIPTAPRTQVQHCAAVCAFTENTATARTDTNRHKQRELCANSNRH